MSSGEPRAERSHANETRSATECLLLNLQLTVQESCAECPAVLRLESDVG